MVYDYKEIQFLDLTVYVENSDLKTKFFSKLTDNHECLDARSLHRQGVFRSIPRTVANRVRRNCTDDSEFVRAKSEYSNYLLRASYNINSTDNAFQNVQLLSQEILVRTTKEIIKERSYIKRNISTLSTLCSSQRSRSKSIRFLFKM